LDPNKPPQTLAELKDAAAKLKAAGITPFGGGDQEGILGAFLISQVFPAYGTAQDSVDIVNGKIPWTDKKVVDSWNTAKELYADFPSDVLSVPYFTEGVNRFLQGKQAIFPGLVQFITGSGDFNFPKSLGADNIGVLPPFGIDGTGNYVPAGAQVGWGIPKSSKNVDAAVAYAKFITGKESQALQLQQAGIVPNNKLVDVQAPNDALAQLVQYTKDTPTQVALHQITNPTVGDVVLAQMQLFFRGEKTAEEALQEIQQKQEATVKP
jgi:ABC-type glycerol-3-phosphate transport system substrate-binding protein